MCTCIKPQYRNTPKDMLVPFWIDAFIKLRTSCILLAKKTKKKKKKEKKKKKKKDPTSTSL